MSLRIKHPQQKTPWSQLARHIEIPQSVLNALAKESIRVFVSEAKKDFAKRGWSLENPHGGLPLHKSFSFKVVKGAIHIQSSFWRLDILAHQDIPAQRMTWLTQDAKDQHPSRYTERSAKKRNTPLVIPLKADNGDIIFRMAPLSRADAWVHPKIAKFTFIERAVRQINKVCEEILLLEVSRQLANGNPLK